MAELSNEAEEALENLFKDARNSAKDFAPTKHNGRLLDVIDEEIDLVRSELGIEL
jgi:hypothetical protein